MTKPKDRSAAPPADPPREDLAKVGATEGRSGHTPPPQVAGRPVAQSRDTQWRRGGLTRGEEIPATLPAARDAGAPRREDIPFKVRATKLGYYDHTRRRVGDVFYCKKAIDLSPSWMERVPPDTSMRHTSPNQAIAREHDAILGAKSPGGMLAGDDNVPDDLPEGTGNPLDAD